MASSWDVMATVRGYNTDGKVVARYSIGRSWTSQFGHVARISTGPCYARSGLDLAPLWAEANGAGFPLPKDWQIQHDPEVNNDGDIVTTETSYHVYFQGRPGEIITRSGTPIGLKYNAEPIIPWDAADPQARTLWHEHGPRMVERLM